MRKFLSGLVGLVATCIVSSTAWAVPISLDPEHPVSVYDTGGQLDPGNNGGFTLGGLEAAPGGNVVYVVAANVSPGGLSLTLRLIRSAGLGTAVLDGSGAQPWSYWSRGNDLTHLNGNYYVAACVQPGKGDAACSGAAGGIYGFVPGVGSTTFATGGSIPDWATSGLTFNSAGTQALVSSDVGIGMWTVTPPSSGVLFANDGPTPGGYVSGVDDHVVTLDGRIITIGDGSRLLHDVTGGPGSIFEFFDLADIPGSSCSGGAIKGAGGSNYDVASDKGPVDTCFGFGSRGAVDPVSGDIFVAFGTGGTSIFRIAADGSSGSVFATGFAFIRDLDFGPANDGNGFSLYVTEVTGFAGGGKGPVPVAVGSIYEFPGFGRAQPIIPTLSFWGKLAMILVLMGIAGVMLSRRQRRLA